MKQLTIELSDEEMQSLEKEAQHVRQTPTEFVQSWVRGLGDDNSYDDDYWDDASESFGMTRPSPEDIVNNTFASNPGHVQVQWTQFFRAFPALFFGFSIATGFWLWLMLAKSLWWGLPLFVTLAFLWVITKRVTVQFQSGDTNPGVIISHQPPLVAVQTDLSKGRGAFPVIKIIEQPLKACGLGNAPIGTRVATCSCYSPAATEAPHWADFDPVIVPVATRRADVIQASVESIPEAQWRQLETDLSQLTERKPGIYPIGWTAKEGTLFES